MTATKKATNRTARQRLAERELQRRRKVQAELKAIGRRLRRLLGPGGDDRSLVNALINFDNETARYKVIAAG